MGVHTLPDKVIIDRGRWELRSLRCQPASDWAPISRSVFQVRSRFWITMSSTSDRQDRSSPVSRDWRLSHIIIEDVMPSVDGGRYPAKRIVGEPCVVEADIFRDGTRELRAAIKWRRKEDA